MDKEKLIQNIKKVFAAIEYFAFSLAESIVGYFGVLLIIVGIMCEFYFIAASEAGIIVGTDAILWVIISITSLLSIGSGGFLVVNHWRNRREGRRA